MAAPVSLAILCTRKGGRLKMICPPPHHWRGWRGRDALQLEFARAPAGRSRCHAARGSFGRAQHQPRPGLGLGHRTRLWLLCLANLRLARPTATPRLAIRAPGPRATCWLVTCAESRSATRNARAALLHACPATARSKSKPAKAPAAPPAWQPGQRSMGSAPSTAACQHSAARNPSLSSRIHPNVEIG
jgi:hypothetical protein